MSTIPRPSSTHSTDELIYLLRPECRHSALLLSQDFVDFDIASFLRLLPQAALEPVQSRCGLIATVADAADKCNPLPLEGVAQLHTDGLYCPAIPDYVLLYCQCPGDPDTPTVLVDTRPVIDTLERTRLLPSLRALKLEYAEVPGTSKLLPVVLDHPLTGEPTIILGSYGAPRPSPREKVELTASEVALMSRLNVLLQEASEIVHPWSRGTLLLFDNYNYLHRRQRSRPSPQRRLLRLWLKAEESPK